MQTISNNEIRETIFHHPQRIGVDHVTVTPHDEDGYVGLLLVVELDTKFPQAYPIRDYTAQTVALILFKHYTALLDPTTLCTPILAVHSPQKY